jgi:hypothetical protein
MHRLIRRIKCDGWMLCTQYATTYLLAYSCVAQHAILYIVTSQSRPLRPPSTWPQSTPVLNVFLSSVRRSIGECIFTKHAPILFFHNTLYTTHSLCRPVERNLSKKSHRITNKRGICIHVCMSTIYIPPVRWRHSQYAVQGWMCHIGEEGRRGIECSYRGVRICSPLNSVHHSNAFIEISCSLRSSVGLLSFKYK